MSIRYFLTKLSYLFICNWQIILFYFKLKLVDTFITSKELIIITLVILKLFYFIFFGSFLLEFRKSLKHSSFQFLCLKHSYTTCLKLDGGRVNS